MSYQRTPKEANIMPQSRISKQVGENVAEVAKADTTKKNSTKTRRLFARKHREPKELRKADERRDSGGLFRGLFHGDKERNTSEADERENGSKSSTGSRSSLVSKLFSGKHHGQAQASQSRTERTQAKVVYDSFGDSSVLRVVEEESELTEPLPDCVWIKVQASSLTLHDCLTRHGVEFSLTDPCSLPITPGTDLVGHIVKCRAEELPEQYCIGDRVAAVVRAGAHSRFVQVPISNLLQVVPQTLDAADVAAVISHYTIAYQALRAVTPKQRPMLSLNGKSILILLHDGLLDGTSQAILQLCKKAKAIVYVVAPASRHAYLRNVLGVLPLPVEEDWSERVEAEIDLVFDATAEDNCPEHKEQMHMMERSLSKNQARIVQYGFASLLKQPATANLCGAPLSLHWKQAMSMITSSSRVVVLDSSFRRFQHDPSRFRQDVQTLLQWLRWNKLAPHVSKRLGLNDVAKWHLALETADPSIRGSLVMLPWRQVS